MTLITPAAGQTVPLPPERPAIAFETARAPEPAPAPALVCRDPRLEGRQTPDILGPIPGCAIADPVQLTGISGIGLSTPAVLDCRTARTFANWVTGVAAPAARQILGGRLGEIWVMGSYACRTQNGLHGTRLSEHAVGRAVDIGGVTLADGRRITVLNGWHDRTDGEFLKRVKKQACGMFRTVLGPDADRFHRDHLHFDTAYRENLFCR